MEYDRKEQLIDEGIWNHFYRELPDELRFSDMFLSELIIVVTIADQFLLVLVVCERTIISRLDGDPNRALCVAWVHSPECVSSEDVFAGKLR